VQRRAAKSLVHPLQVLASELSKPHVRELQKFLHAEWSRPSPAIYPPKDMVFRWGGMGWGMRLIGLGPLLHPHPGCRLPASAGARIAKQQLPMECLACPCSTSHMTPIPCPPLPNPTLPTPPIPTPAGP
jgi:hypothetical protein